MRRNWQAIVFHALTTLLAVRVFERTMFDAAYEQLAGSCLLPSIVSASFFVLHLVAPEGEWGVGSWNNEPEQ